jgi:hypothetical protein
MKPKILLWAILSGVLAISNAGFSADDYSRGNNRWYDDGRDFRQLQGRWYKDGDRNQPTEIVINGRRLEARNENGQTSRLQTDRAGNIHASDWNVNGIVRNDRIDWNNGTTWSRRPSERFGSFPNGRLRHLEGRWYVNGDRNKSAEIYTKGKRLEARNENGQITRLDIDRNGDVLASDWQGIRGDVRGNRIQWSNGTTWRKS